MFDFEGFRRWQESARAIARNAPPGLPLEHLVPGALVTVSANKATGDRSYTDDILEVLAQSGSTVVCRSTGLCGNARGGRSFPLQYHEHEYYAAESLAEAVRLASEQERQASEHFPAGRAALKAKEGDRDE